VHAVVIPLLTSDLPSFLWWRSRKWPSGRAFKSIASDCNRVILDTSVLADSPSGVRGLDELMHGGTRGQGPRFSIADLAWSRLTPWRIALAELYDLPAYRRHLNLAGRFSLTYQPGVPGAPDIPASSLLAAGWLASRLQWGPGGAATKSGKGYSIQFSNKVELVLSPADSVEKNTNDAAGGRVDKLKVETLSGTPSVFSIGLVDGCIGTTIVIDGGQPVSRIVGSGQIADTDLVGEELDILGNDSTYEAAVSVGADIAAKIAAAAGG
jgi:hypothetical protein